MVLLGFDCGGGGVDGAVSVVELLRTGEDTGDDGGKDELSTCFLFVSACRGEDG